MASSSRRGRTANDASRRARSVAVEQSSRCASPTARSDPRAWRFSRTAANKHPPKRLGFFKTRRLAIAPATERAPGAHPTSTARFASNDPSSSADTPFSRARRLRGARDALGLARVPIDLDDSGEDSDFAASPASASERRETWFRPRFRNRSGRGLGRRRVGRRGEGCGG